MCEGAGGGTRARRRELPDELAANGSPARIVEMPAAAEIGIEGATVTGKEAAGMGIETGSEMGGGAGKGVGREIVLVGRAALAEAVAVGGGSCFTFFDYFSQFILGRVFFVAHVLDGNKQQETRM